MREQRGGEAGSDAERLTRSTTSHHERMSATVALTVRTMRTGCGTKTRAWARGIPDIGLFDPAGGSERPGGPLCRPLARSDAR